MMQAVPMCRMASRSWAGCSMKARSAESAWRWSENWTSGIAARTCKWGKRQSALAGLHSQAAKLNGKALIVRIQFAMRELIGHQSAKLTGRNDGIAIGTHVNVLQS